MNIQLFGKRLQKYMRSDEAYDLLDSESETRGSTWAAGGCWTLAQALHAVLPGSRLVAVLDRGVQQHVLVELNGWYLDADGASSQQTLLKRWKKLEGLIDPRVVRFNPNTAEDLVCPVALVQKLIDRFETLAQT